MLRRSQNELLPAASVPGICVAQSSLSECRGDTVEGLSTEAVAYPTSGYARRIFAFDFFVIAPSSTQSRKEKLAALVESVVGLTLGAPPSMRCLGRKRSWKRRRSFTLVSSCPDTKPSHLNGHVDGGHGPRRADHVSARVHTLDCTVVSFGKSYSAPAMQMAGRGPPTDLSVPSARETDQLGPRKRSRRHAHGPG